MEFCDTVMEKSWKNHGILSRQFRGNPVVGSYASLSVCLSVCHWIISHISGSITLSEVYFQSMSTLGKNSDWTIIRISESITAMSLTGLMGLRNHELVKNDI